MISETYSGLSVEQLRAKRVREMTKRFEAFGLGSDVDAERALGHLALIDAELVNR